jgi:3-phenylpropionate/trans-cinnamate dioxygenase ferredoxin reductase subunit
MSEPETHVVVGGGMAGAKAVAALREEGFDGEIVLLGNEEESPYERPPLSKDYLRGETSREDARVHPEAFYDDAGIDLRTGVEVIALDPAARQVELRGGERVGYDRLLLATGSEPRRLSLPGAELDGVHYLRDLADADALAAALDRAERLAVIGGGWIGAEVAASARQKGVRVDLIERRAVPLEHVLGKEVGSIYAEVHRSHGVTLRTDSALESLEGDGRVERVRLAGGEAVECDLVVAGIGVTPRTALAEAAGIAVENGVLADERLETSSPGVFAAGDIANALHPFYGRRLRVEHWANAARQGEQAARAMLDKPATEEPVPYFFSDQYDVGMEYTGYAADWDEVVFRGDPIGGEFIAFWRKDGRVVAGMNVNVWDVADDIDVLIRSRREVPVERLRDDDVPLGELIGGEG